jgi:hypothetical protein
MENCKICNEEFKNLKGLVIHVNFKHGLNGKQYYDEFIKKEGEGECSVCGKETTFRGRKVGYLKTCSIKCSSLDKDYRKKRSDLRKGKKQSEETIEKRIKNTNQEKKELTRKKTMLNKYGVDNPTKLDEIKDKVRVKLSGSKLNRTDEWQKNIIDSKRKNNTLKHNAETKNKISDSLNKFYSENLDREKYISTSNNVKHLSGWYNNLYFRSSLELSFLINNSDKTFSTCEIKKYAVKYNHKNKLKTYFPDYTDGNFIYEIKPTSLLGYGVNPIKIEKGKEIFGDNYLVITETESPYVTKQKIIELISSGVVKLTKNSENIFKKYKY